MRGNRSCPKHMNWGNQSTDTLLSFWKIGEIQRIAGCYIKRHKFLVPVRHFDCAGRTLMGWWCVLWPVAWRFTCIHRRRRSKFRYVKSTLTTLIHGSALICGRKKVHAVLERIQKNMTYRCLVFPDKMALFLKEIISEGGLLCPAAEKRIPF